MQSYFPFNCMLTKTEYFVYGDILLFVKFLLREDYRRFKRSKKLIVIWAEIPHSNSLSYIW
jgi:hypothetical protein